MKEYREEYITDEEMYELGFKKIKSYRKKQVGVSKYIWEHHNGFTLTIEKHHNEDVFRPTLEIQKKIFGFSNIVQLKLMLDALNVLPDCINDIKENKLAEIFFTDGQPVRAMSNYLMETMQLLYKYKCVLGDINVENGYMTGRYIEMNDDEFINALEYVLKDLKGDHD